MNQAWIHGDPFGVDASAVLLRAFLELASQSGLLCALAPGGDRWLRHAARLPRAEAELVAQATERDVAATAPVVVFAPATSLADAVTMAGFERPLAAAVIAARDGALPADLLQRLRAELRWAGTENPPHALEERELAPWLALPPPAEGGPIVHVGAADQACGTDLIFDCWQRHHAAAGRSLRLVLPDAENGPVEELRRRGRESGGVCEILRGPFEPAHLRDAAAVVMPWRRPRATRTLVLCLASGRPVCASSFAGTAAVIGRPGVCLPIGGRYVPAGAGVPGHFEPHPPALSSALQQALSAAAATPSAISTVGRAARRHVVEELTNARPSAPPAAVPPVRTVRTTIVLEAPFFDSSPAATSAIATAQALAYTGAVELRLVPRQPFEGGLGALRARAPELEPLLCRDAVAGDLWLSWGRPMRGGRPNCRVFVLAVDCGLGASGLEDTLVTEDADVVIVPDQRTSCALVDAGTPEDRILIVPPGEAPAMALEQIVRTAAAPALRSEPVITLPASPVRAPEPAPASS